MSDMNTTIIPKSDQLNYDDFIGKESMIIKITKVVVGTGEQKVSIFYENDNGKPYKACKSMCRVLVYCWGPDSKQYVGRSIQLYGDSKVKWAGLEVGGIRISHLSHITEPMTMALSASKGNRKPYTVKPLIVEVSSNIVDQYSELMRKSADLEDLKKIYTTALQFKVDKDGLSKLLIVKDEMKKLFESK